MAKITFMARVQEMTSERFVIVTDAIYIRQLFVFWGLLFLFGIGLFGLGIYAIFQNLDAVLVLWCGLILLVVAFIFAITLKTRIEIIIESDIHTITVIQKKLFQSDFNNSLQTTSLVSLQSPKIKWTGVEHQVFLHTDDLELVLRFRKHHQAKQTYSYLSFIRQKIHLETPPR